MSGRTQVRRIVVLRSQVWKSALSFWKLPIVQGRTGLILVKFTGDDNLFEPSADDGGPRREFFTLLREAILHNSGVFTTGRINHTSLSHYVVSEFNECGFAS